MQNTKVTVEVDGTPTWERYHDCDGNPSGATYSNVEILKYVATALQESIQQVNGQLDLMNPSL